MTDDEVIALATTDAAEAIEIARTSGNESVVFITGNSYMPPLRAFGQAETVWKHDDNDEGELFAFYAEQFEKVLEAANVTLDCHPDDNSLYVVDMNRFERRDDADESETLSGEWIARPDVGDDATFTYPDYGTPVGFPDHVAHSGQTCTLVRELGDDERDPEVGRMFIARFADGVELTVNHDELSATPDECANGCQHGDADDDPTQGA